MPRPRLARRWQLGLAALGLAACLGNGLPPPAAARPAAQQSGTLVVDTPVDAESMDPAFVLQAAGESIMKSLFDYLIERDADGNLVPMLADSWTVVDPTTVDFHLRQGVAFSNGEPFNAESVRFSISRILDPRLNSQAATTLANVQQVQVVDEYTARFIMKAPDATLFDALTAFAPMLPPAYYGGHDQDYLSAHPVGSGPFTLVEWVKDDHATLQASPGYWGKDTFKGAAAVDTVVFRPVPQPGTRVADLLAGTADMVIGVPPDEVANLGQTGGSGGVRTVAANTPKLQFIAFQPKNATDPLANRQVRQALNYAVDVDAIVANLFHGLGGRQASPIVAGSLGFDPSVTPYSYNPALARQLLAQAGYPNGFALTVDLSSSDPPDEALAAIGQLKDVGVAVTPRTVDLAQFNDNWFKHTTGDMVAARWGGLQDPAVFLNFNAVCGGLLAAPPLCDPRTTALIKQAGQTLDQDARAGLYAQLSQALHDDPLAIYLANDVSIYGVGPRVVGWRGPTGRDLLIPTNIALQS